MKAFKLAARSKGFSLIEVLIAVVIISFGLLALAALQTKLIQSSSEAKAQSVALALAKDKLEEMRSYTNLNGYAALGSSGTAETLSDSSGSGVNFTRSWTVRRYALATGATTFTQLGAGNVTGALPSGYISNNEFKTIDVRVSWTDASGQERTIAMEDAVAGLDPQDTARTLRKRGGTARGPEVIINDPANEAGVIPIAVGDSTDTAATNPKPIVTSKLVETRFDIFTYHTLGGGIAQAQAKVETTVVGCTCTNATTTTVGYRPTYWNGLRYVPPVQSSTAAPARAANNVIQSRYCDACCRDHHDPSGVSGAKFSPRRSSHSHFNLVNGTLQAAVAGGNYVEACRLIRVDGIFDVAADPSNDYYNLLETNSALNSATTRLAAPTDGTIEQDHNAVANYQGFVLNYLNRRYVTPNPGTGSESATYNNRANPSPAVDAAAHNLDVPTSLRLQNNGDSKWLHARGLYADYLEQEALDAIGDAKSNCPGTGGSPPTAAQKRDCVLRILPFTSINLTEVGNWLAANATQISVTNNDFSGSTGSNPVRGKVMRLNGATPDTTVNANTRAGHSASGLKASVDLWEINPDDVSGVMTDQQEFEIVGGQSGGGGQFVVNLNAYTTSGTAVVRSSLHPDACSASGAGLTHSCSSQITLPSSANINIENYNQSFTDNRTNPCQTNKLADMPYRVAYDITSITSSNAGASIGTLQVNNPDQPGGSGAGGEFTVVPVGSIANGDTFTVSFSSPLYYCPTSYTCGGAGNKVVTYSSTFNLCPGGGTTRPDGPPTGQ